MINIKIKKNFNYKFNKKVTCLGNNLNFNSFFILDDNTKIDSSKLNRIIDEIQLYGYKVNIVTMTEIANKVIKFLENSLIDEFDTIVLLGEGGSRFFALFKDCSIFKDKKIVNLKWSRSWSGDSANFFETNIDEFDINNERIVIFEDVIASGETIMNIKDYLENNGNQIMLLITCLMQETSPMANNNFCNTIVGNLINKSTSSDLDPFWYPPIYSLRHLIYGDEEMSKFYDSLSKRYFKSEKSIEKLIKEMRQ